MEKMTLPELLSSLGSNQIFGAGAGLVGVGVFLTIAKRGLQIGTIVFRRRCMISLEVNSRDIAYDWLLKWINKRAAGATRHLSVQTSFAQSESGSVRADFSLVPSPGDHFVWYRGRLIKIERQRESQMQLVDKMPFETVTLTTFGTDPRFYGDTILEEARQMAFDEMKFGTTVYQSVGHEWRPFGHPRRKRSLASVVLDEGVSNRIYFDVREFISNTDWYAERGVPYRRGYLLYGPPGCGKSSFVSALAGELGYSICMLSLSERTLTDDRLHHLLNVAPVQSILLLEDVDAAFPSREEEEDVMAKKVYDGLVRVTFSGLLNALDGVASSEGRLLFMTTNYVHRLDPALIRPGRVDLKEYVGYCSDYQLTEMFKKFYPDSGNSELPARFLSELEMKLKEYGFSKREISAAEVQGHFLTFKNKPEEAVKNSGSIFDRKIINCANVDNKSDLKLNGG